MKNFFPILLCLLIIPSESVSAWWWSSDKTSIEGVCQKAWTANQQADQSKKSSKETMEIYVRLLRAIDIRSCPDDFRTAFLDYLHAADAFVPYYSKYEGLFGMISGGLEMITSMHDKSSEEGSRLIKNIQEKKSTLENIANKHGAKIPDLPPGSITEKAYLSR